MHFYKKTLTKLLKINYNNKVFTLKKFCRKIEKNKL